MFRKKVQVLLSVAGLLAFPLLSACGDAGAKSDIESNAAHEGNYEGNSNSGDDINSGGNSGNSDKTDNENNTDNTGGYPVTVDNYGREVIVEKMPEKVLTLGPNCTELFAALGLDKYVIGRSLANHSRGPLEEYADAVNGIPEINHASVTREAVISSGADFIYALNWEISDEGCSIEEAAQYGITVYVNSAMTLEEQYQEILDIGKIFGVEEKAEAFIADQEARIQAVREKISGKEPVDVLVYDSGNDGVFTCSGINFESLLVETAGGHNIFGDLEERQWVTVSYEEVLRRNPDIILIHDYDSPSLEEKIREIQENPILSRLDCVQEGRFASITLESVLPGNRMADAVEAMAESFYGTVQTAGN